LRYQCVPRDLGADGLGKPDIADTDWQPRDRGPIHLDGVRVSADALIGPEGSAFRSVPRSLERGT